MAVHGNIARIAILVRGAGPSDLRAVMERKCRWGESWAVAIALQKRLLWGIEMQLRDALLAGAGITLGEMLSLRWGDHA